MSKVETMRAKDKKKGSLVPRLRFPEFVGTGEWEIQQLDKRIDLLTGYPFNGIDISETPKGIRLLRGINVTEGFVRHSHEIDRYYSSPCDSLEKFKLKTGDLVIGMDGSKVGKNSALITDADAEALLVQRVARIRTQCTTLTTFIFHHINSKKFHLYVDKINTSSGIPHISPKQIKDFEIAFPSTSEQQRIADCLSSLDERITAEANKLNALKAHKSGLLKQLFPAEGETLPALRFPEFRDAGEWEEKKLGDICEKIMDGTHFSPKSKCGPFLYLTSKNIQNGALDLSNTSNISEEEHRQIFAKCPVKIKDILLTKDGANTGNCALNSLSVEFSLLSSVAVLRGKQTSIVQEFLYHTIGSPFIQKIIQESISGQAITRITLEKVGSYRIFLPIKPEQQRIADCLSSLDELITAQTQKIDLLKTHKKGLMQQLFPVIDEAKA